MDPRTERTLKSLEKDMQAKIDRCAQCLAEIKDALANPEDYDLKGVIEDAKADL